MNFSDNFFRRVEKKTNVDKGTIIDLPKTSGEFIGTAQIKITDEKGRVVESPFSYNRLFLKNNVSNWGSCSTKRNINLNVNLVNLPEHLIRYVILHELCHLVYMNHGTRFHALLDSVCGGKEKELAKQLRGYSLL